MFRPPRCLWRLCPARSSRELLPTLGLPTATAFIRRPLILPRNGRAIIKRCSPPASRYRGHTIDFQNTSDTTTRYVGGGPNTGRFAIANFFDDNIMSHASFPAVWKNGQLVQLNQNANRENTLADAVSPGRIDVLSLLRPERLQER